MKVGLVRHFRVQRGYPRSFILSQNDLFQWVAEYDASDIEPAPVDLGGIEWRRCYASDLSRAAKTAEIIYGGEILHREQLREIQMYPLFKRNIRLPFLLWPILIRLAWLLNHKSQRESQTAIRQRVATFFDEVLAQGDEDVLIVSHGAIMMYVRQELLKRGFAGPKLGSPKNGWLYLFER